MILGHITRRDKRHPHAGTRNDPGLSPIDQIVGLVAEDTPPVGQGNRFGIGVRQAELAVADALVAAAFWTIKVKPTLCQEISPGGVTHRPCPSGEDAGAGGGSSVGTGCSRNGPRGSSFRLERENRNHDSLDTRRGPHGNDRCADAHDDPEHQRTDVGTATFPLIRRHLLIDQYCCGQYLDRS